MLRIWRDMNGAVASSTQGTIGAVTLQGAQTQGITRGFYGGRANVPEGYYRGISASITYLKTAFVITNQIAKFIANKPFYISKIESAITQQFLQSNSYALVDNVGIVGDFTSENDLLPNDWTEPDSPSGEDVIPT